MRHFFPENTVFTPYIFYDFPIKMKKVNSEVEMAGRTIHILIGGEAGQGLVTIGQILAKTLVRSGFYIVVTQDYQSRIRGGHNTFSIRTGETEICAPQEMIDLLIALDARTVDLHKGRLSSGGLVVTGDDGEGKGSCIKVPFKTLAPDKHFNTVALGVAGEIIGLEEERLGQAIDDFFGHKDPSLTGENRKALNSAFIWSRTQRLTFPKLKPLLEPQARWMMNGNEAIALGALSAGLRFFSFYPMTPATSIGLTLGAQAGNMGLIVEQAEDEIGAVNMAIGASFAGAPAMVATSGGGFALMVEGVSLAAMTETPLVIVVAQRPGPATGLPTRTEQADLEFVLQAGHGEFPRAVLAPGSAEECFHLTRKALFLADTFQTPIFLLTDQFLADSYRGVAPFEGAPFPELQPGQEGSLPFPYQRYAMTDSGVSPRLLPGRTEHLVVADSDEHAADGHLTEDLTVRNQMVGKRLKKFQGLVEQAVPPEFSGDQRPELLLVTWGSSKGSVLEAAARLRKRGKRVAAFSFSQVWPLVSKQILPVLKEAREVIGVEGNAVGQFSRLVRRETGFHIAKKILRYDGLPITPEFILRKVEG
jgi:2-oxoglutarate/2-oxoacid ferredoxin oxidoreductase subunit alpha